MTPALDALAAMRNGVAGAAAVACVNVQHARGAVLEAHGEGALVQFQFLHHVAVEGGAGAGVCAPSMVWNGMCSSTPSKYRPMRLKSAPRSEKRASKSSLELTPGRLCTARSGSSASTLARFLASLPASTRVEGPSWRAVSNGPAVTSTRVGLAERIGAENDFEVLGLAGIQVERLLDQAVADGGDVEHVVARRDGRNAEMAGGVGGGAIGAAHQLNVDVGERLPAAGVHHRAADFAGRLRICGHGGQGQAKPRQPDPMH